VVTQFFMLFRNKTKIYRL